jgi:hypothetical protein
VYDKHETGPFPLPKNIKGGVFMLKINKVTYEIWDASSYEVLVDNLTFEDAAEQCKIYADFYCAEVMVVAVDSTKIIDFTTTAKQYKSAYMDYLDIIFRMGNAL